MNDAFLTDPARSCANPRVSHLFTSNHDRQQERAKVICGGCPFRDECLRYAVEHGEMWHVWAGYLMSSPTERAAAGRRLDGRTAEQVRRLREHGKNDAQIGQILGVATSTVRRHRLRLGLPALPKPGRPRLRVSA